MPMAAKGLAKLAEECGELLQVIGKKLAYFDTDKHPDNGPPLSLRLEDEIADVMSACEFVIEIFDLNKNRILNRRSQKLKLFRSWHAEPENKHASDIEKELL